MQINFNQISAQLREFEGQGYPVDHLFISALYKKELAPYLRIVDGQTFIPMNGKEYEVKGPQQLVFGNVANYIDGQEEGIYLVGPGGDKISLLPSSLEDNQIKWMS